VLVATTMLSHGWKSSTQLSARMVSTIRRELNLERSDQFELLVQCPLTREDYLETATR